MQAASKESLRQDASFVLCVLRSLVQASLQNRGTLLSRTGHWSVRGNNFRVFTDRGRSKSGEEGRAITYANRGISL